MDVSAHLRVKRCITNGCGMGRADELHLFDFEAITKSLDLKGDLQALDVPIIGLHVCLNQRYGSTKEVFCLTDNKFDPVN